ncbi:hypothetical protein D0862_03841 [Hortaea werneckii]|uniref:SGNH hydrolase-type esterase domain-containing protein n=1 Tax=Hortaea werneckii TaxID=91943 RepID=A0A3M7H6J7_HORWE|nr:hypothetical protein D0862_03841 [Hortaea werneckii]
MTNFRYLIIALCLAVLAASKSINNGMKLKVLPLGASIVWGQNSADGNGFRGGLRKALIAGGNKYVSMVGTVRHGNMAYNACEGFPGQVIQSVANKALEHRVYTDYYPNVILIHVGTNDCWAGSSASTMAGRITWMLNSIKTRQPRTFILLSTLIPSRNANQEACIRRFNAALPGVVAAAKRGGQKVALVDMHAVVPAREISGDGTHPTNAGYQLMAKAWYRAMVKHAGKISAPNPKGRPAPR